MSYANAGEIEDDIIVVNPYYNKAVTNQANQPNHEPKKRAALDYSQYPKNGYWPNWDWANPQTVREEEEILAQKRRQQASQQPPLPQPHVIEQIPQSDASSPLPTQTVPIVIIEEPIIITKSETSASTHPLSKIMTYFSCFFSSLSNKVHPMSDDH